MAAAGALDLTRERLKEYIGNGCRSGLAVAGRARR
jgi:hypothetical protein